MMIVQRANTLGGDGNSSAARFNLPLPAHGTGSQRGAASPASRSARLAACAASPRPMVLRAAAARELQWLAQLASSAPATR